MSPGYGANWYKIKFVKCINDDWWKFERNRHMLNFTDSSLFEIPFIILIFLFGKTGIEELLQFPLIRVLRQNFIFYAFNRIF